MLSLTSSDRNRLGFTGFYWVYKKVYLVELAEGKASRDVQVDFRLGERSAGVDGALVAAEATRQRRLVVSRIGGVFDIQLGFLPAVVGCDQVSLPLRR